MSGMDFTIDEMKTIDRHFNMVVEKVIEMWAEQCTRKKPREVTGSGYRDRFTFKTSFEGDSVVLTIRLMPEMKESNAVHKVTGYEDTARMTLGLE